jgi:hypothetical protein
VPESGKGLSSGLTTIPYGGGTVNLDNQVVRAGTVVTINPVDAHGTKHGMVQGSVTVTAEGIGPEIRRRLAGWLRPTAACVKGRDFKEVDFVVERIQTTVWIDEQGRLIDTTDAGQYFMGLESTCIMGKKEVYRPGFAFRHWLADFIEPKTDLLISDYGKAIARGDLDCETEYERLCVDNESEDEPKLPDYRLGDLNTPHIKISNSKSRRNRRVGMRIPVLAGDIARRVRHELPGLDDTGESRLMVKTVVTRLINALIKQHDVQYVNMRSKEILEVSQWASELFWEETTAEEGIRMYREAKPKKQDQRAVLTVQHSA